LLTQIHAYPQKHTLQIPEIIDTYSSFN